MSKLIIALIVFMGLSGSVLANGNDNNQKNVSTQYYSEAPAEVYNAVNTVLTNASELLMTNKTWDIEKTNQQELMLETEWNTEKLYSIEPTRRYKIKADVEEAAKGTELTLKLKAQHNPGKVNHWISIDTYDYEQEKLVKPVLSILKEDYLTPAQSS